MFSKFIRFLWTKSEARTRVVIFGIMLIGGIAALIASFALTTDEFQLDENPNAVLSCSINIVLNCSTVMQTWQSHIFGFPNMLIGLMAFPVIITLAVAGLAGVKFPRWMLIVANVGILLGLIFAYWLFFQSLYAIQVLCPWCLVVTTSMTLIFATMLHYNLKQNSFGLSKKVDQKVQRFLSGGFHQMLVLSWIALMVVLVFIQFGQALFAQ